MPNPNLDGYNTPTEHSEQGVLNYSFDDNYKLLMTGLLAYNSSTGMYDRVQINAAGQLITSSSGGAGGDASAANQVLEIARLTTVTTDLDYRFSGGKTAYVGTINAAGNTSLITPAAGKRLQIYWLSFLPSSDNANANIVSIGFGTTAGAISTELYRAYAMAHWELFTGGVNQSLIINNATAEAVAVTVHYKEIT